MSAGPIRNLGRVLSILLMQEVNRFSLHADASAFSAPSECHDDIERAVAFDRREARRMAEAEARRPLRVILREARRRGFQLAGPRYERTFHRVYQLRGFPY